MRFTPSVPVALVAMCIGAFAFDDKQAQMYKDKLREARIIPDVLDEFQPLTMMKITFHDDLLLDIGTEVTPEDVADPPHIWFSPPSTEAHYTLAMFDSDSQKPLMRQWVAININGTKPGASFRDPTREHQYTSYEAPMPTKDSGKHRYVFVLLEQQEKSQVMMPAIEQPEIYREGFNINQFAADNNLKPVAANYMVVGHQSDSEVNPESVSNEILSSNGAPSLASPSVSASGSKASSAGNPLNF